MPVSKITSSPLLFSNIYTQYKIEWNTVFVILESQYVNM